MNQTNGEYRIRKGGDRVASVVIAGDYCPRGDVIDRILNGESDSILKAVKPFLNGADLRIIQFETPISLQGCPTDKTGPNLKSPPGCERFVTAGGFDVATLANNHIGDLGPNVVIETKRVLEQANIKTVGAGSDIEEACEPLCLAVNGIEIGILNVAENEFGIAKIGRPGAAPLDLLETSAQIRALKKQVDICLLIVHGGNEFYPLPSPRMKKWYRAFANAGADAVVNIHTHCPQGIDVWHGVPIIFSPGNFFFTGPEYDVSDLWFYGYLPKITFDKGGACRIEIAPYHYRPDPWRIELLTDDFRSRFLNYIETLSALAADDKASGACFDAWCAMMGEKYMSLLQERFAIWPIDPKNRDHVKKMLLLRNLFTCETHAEVMSRYLRLLEEVRLDDALAHRPRIEALRRDLFDPPLVQDAIH